MREPVAIVGIGCRFPGAEGPRAFWDLLAAGVDAVGPVPADRWDAAALFDAEPGRPGRANTQVGGFLARVDGFDARFFGVSAGEAAAMDPQQRLALEVAVEALEDAGLPLDRLAGTATGVFMGASSADYAQLALRDPDTVDMFTNAGAAASAIANRISYHLDLRGPSLVLDTACSGSLVAVLTACRSLWAGECEVALAGGVNVLLSPAVHVGFAQALSTSPNGRCAAFGEGADGMVRGEGVGVVVLKPLARAQADGDRVYAVVRGGAINQDGRTNGITAPNPAGQRALLAAACRDAGVAPAEVGYVEAHGTGTPLGDPIEVAALGAVFGPGRAVALRLGAVKSNLGHLEAAAGVAGLIKAALAVWHGALPPTLHAEAPSGRVAWESLGLALQQELGAWPAGPRLAGVSAFGFAGTNCHVLLGSAPAVAPGDAVVVPAAAAVAAAAPAVAAAAAGEGVWVLPLSAKDPAALAALAGRWSEALRRGDVSAADACWTAIHGRTLHPVRRAIAAADAAGLAERLTDINAADPATFPRAAARRRPVVFLYPGMGAQRAGMGRALLAEPAFRAAVAAVDLAIAPYLAEGELGAWSVLAALDSDGADGRWERGDVAQALQFALQVGLTALLRSWGLRPDAVVGSSLGELAAAWAAGALSLEDAAKVVARRGSLMQSMAGTGTVAMVALDGDAATALLEPWADRAWVAALNGPRQTLLAGDQVALEAAIARVEAAGGFGRLVRGTLVASHSPVVEPLRERLLAALADLAPREASLPLWSTVTGAKLDGPLDAAYWWANMRSPVRLGPTVAALAADGRPPIFVELAAHPALGPAVAETLAAAGLAGDVVGTLRRDRAEPLAAREALGGLWALGAAVDWAAVQPAGGRLAGLPTYAWRHERHWLAPAREGVRFVAQAVASVPVQVPEAGVALRREDLLALAPVARVAAIQASLARELAQLLDVAAMRLDPDAPLTTLGVGSLVGMELNNRVRRELGVALPMALLLEGPSLARLAGAIADRLRPELPDLPLPAPVVPRPAELPASWAQRRMWFLERLAPGLAGYQVAGAVRLRGALDEAGLGRTLDAIVARHEALRTALPTLADGPVQVIAPPRGVPLPRLDLAALPAARAETEARKHLEAEAARPFDLAQGPLMRATLVRLATDDWLLGVTLHHAVGDGWSLGVLLAELGALYPGGDPDAIPRPPLQYADYALWQRDALAGPAVERQLDYWREALAGLSAELPLPTDKPRPPVRAGQGATLAGWVPEAALLACDQLARNAGATRFMVALSAFMAVLGRWSGADDLCVGTPVSGRHHPGLEGLIGCFLNTLPLRGDLSGDPAFGELVGRVRAAVLAGFANQDVPFERLVEALAPARDLARTPLFQVAFSWHAPLHAPRVAGLTAEAVEVDPGTARFDLALGLHETDGGLRWIAEYDAALWEPATVWALVDGFCAVLGADAELRVSELPLGTVVDAFEAGPALPVAAGGALAGFLAAAATRPSALAVVDGEISWTYGELAARAAGLAARLRAAGVGAGVPVAIVAPRGAGLVLAHVGCALAGAIACPLDPAQPGPRLQAMRDSLAAPVTLVGFTDYAAEAWLLDELTATAEPIAPDWDPERPAYAIFTSGSTGSPKGVVVPAGALAGLVAWHLDAYALAPGDRVPLIASPGFDASIWELWPALAAGATLLVAPPAASSDPAAWPAWLAAAGATVAFMPTPLAEAVLGLPWPAETRLRWLLTGGDRLLHRPPAGLPFTLVNHYGPTEAAVVATAASVAAGDAATAPGIGGAPGRGGAPGIGRAIANTRVRVAGPAGQPLPPGVPGELWIGGAGLARGYWADAELTAARFVTLADGTRWYRSGDRARRSPDGGLAFLGRLDAQIQVRGVRVEPAEIEAALATHPAVAACVVAATNDRLVAWYVPTGTDAADLREWLAARLPAAMVPGVFVPLLALPLTPAGKLDRRALPAPPTETSDAPPQGELEAAVAALWGAVLDLPSVARDADFFALGGHSLLAWRLVAQVQAAFGVALPLAEVFAAPTVAGMARAIAKGGDGAPPPVLRPDPAAAHEPFNATDVQAAYWIGRDASLAGGGVAAHAYVELDVPDLDLARLQQALDALVARHPMLRAVFDAQGRQRVLPNVPPFPLALHEAPDRAAWSHEVRDPATWPLMAMRASRGPAGATRLHIGLDALVADASSLGIMARELAARYADPAADLGPTPAVTFRDYVEALNAHGGGVAATRDRDWWRARLPDLPPGPELPEALGGAPNGPASFSRTSGTLDAAAWARFQARARAAGVSPTAAVLAAFAEALAGWARRPAFTLNLPTFRRLPLHPDLERVVGDFTALTPLALDLGAELGFAERCRAVQQRLWADLDHGAAGGLWVMREWARLHGDGAGFPVVFTSVLDQGELGLGPLGGEIVHAVTQTPQVALDHQVMQVDGGLAWHWDVSDGRYAPGVIALLAAAYGGLLVDLAAADADWAAPARLQVDAPDGDGGPAHPPALLHAGFLAQAAAQPDAVAVLAADRTLTYAELLQAARHLSTLLLAQGAGPERPAALLVDRGWEPVVAVVAASLAGVPWVPVDPAAPAARRADLLARAGTVVALGADGLAIAAPLGPLTAFAGAGPVPRDPAPDGLAPGSPAPDDLAYILFTSGSTGEPKGVAVTHAAAANTIAEVNQRLALGPADRVLAISAPGFDLAVWDVFGPLAAGAAIVVLAPGEAREPAAWAARMRDAGVTVWNSAPPLMAMLLAHAEARPADFPRGLRAALLSGDWIPTGMPAAIRGYTPTCRVVSLGGATEAAIWSIWHEAGQPLGGWTSVPYGRALAGQAFAVVDDRGQPRPLWAEGELRIAGAGLAQGYWRDEVRTSAAFVEAAGKRWYRTGDRGRWRPGPDGPLIEFLGREDGQVKIRGVRIEVGEIEAALLAHPAVREAAVVAVGERHNRRLLAFVTDAVPADLGAWLAARLPEGYLPAQITALPALPLSPSGKLDRRALAAMATGNAPADDGPSADPALTARLAALAADVLGRDSLDPHADLLALGVASIELVRLANRLEEVLGRRPAMAELLGLRSVAAVAAWYAGQGVTAADLGAPRTVALTDLGVPRTVAPTDLGAPGAAAPTDLGAFRAVAPTAALLLDPAAREAFKAARHGLRAFGGDPVALPGVSPDPARSDRSFGPGPVALEALGALLAGLAASARDERIRHRYASAGGLYPIQVHLHVREGAVSGLLGGSWYLHPDGPALQPIRLGARFPADAHVFLNRAIADAAAFAVYLVVDLGAIAPVYGEAARDLALLEAGAMAQVLREAAPAAGLGLCAVGGLDASRVAPDLALGPRQSIALTLLGGPAPGGAGAAWSFLPEANETEWEEFTL